ncbi:hypothetical protein K439DRAFT_1616910 [Ramaria rubella]|nr:hypothetical protein K439DRAFT_1616910 [Ramaria rubella]
MAIYTWTGWQSILGRDGEQFFAPCEDDELQIGVTSGLDCHSSGVFSFTVVNLVTELKYCTENLLLAMMMPGPHEPTAEDLQNHLKFIVDDLLLLYDEGVIVKTPMFPLACLAFICDHPAAVKMSGCADTGHLVSPCTRCSVTQADIFSDKSLKNGFPQCDNAEHEHGTRWFEFARLPYFDVIRMTIIDPMHNLLMGVVKNHCLRCPPILRDRQGKWGSWQVGPYLQIPTKALELYLSFGKNIVCVRKQNLKRLPQASKIVPKHGKEFMELSIELQWRSRNPRNPPVSISCYLGMNALLTSVLATKSRRKKKEIPDPPKAPSIRMRAGEDVLFLKLATAVKIYVQQIITEAEIARADMLFSEYLIGYKQNHYLDVWGGRTQTELSLLCPPSGPDMRLWSCVWVLSFKSNNWGGGHLEGWDVQIRDMIRNVQLSPHGGESFLAKHMVQTTGEVRGTVEDLAVAHEEAIADGSPSAAAKSQLVCGPVVPKSEWVPPRCESALANYYTWAIQLQPPVYL